MLTTPDGQPLESDSNEEDMKLRGGRLEQIRKDLHNGELDDKDKLLKYSSHLDWFMNKFRLLYGYQEAMQRDGKWNRSLQAVGFTNGLVIAMALFLEEQGNPPTRGVPERLKGEEEDIKLLSEEAKGYMITLANQLEAAICASETPKGYEEYPQEEAWARWIHDTVRHLENPPFEITEILAAANRIRKHQKEAMKEDSE